MNGHLQPSDTVAVVLHFRREAMTADCVSALQAQEGGGPRILIVDNDSGDGSATRLRARFPEVPLLETGANLGYAGGNNVGIRWAEAQGAQFVFVVNDDARASTNCVATLRSALESEPQAAAAAPTILHEHPSPVIWWAGGRFDPLRCIGLHERYGERWTRNDAAQAPRRVSFVSGCAVLFRVHSLNATGAFRDDFGAYLEDLELSQRLLKAGWSLLHVPAATLEHRVAYPEPPIAPWKIVLRDRNRRRVARAHLRGVQRAGFAVVFVASRALLVLRYALRGDWPRAKAIVQGMGARGVGMTP